MRKARTRICTTLVLLLASSALPALAAEGRIPIWAPINIGPGMEGKYIVTRDFTAPAAGPAIDIQPGTVAVDIDLNGFTIYGVNPNDVIRARGVDSLTVRNGTIMFGGGSGGQAGINAEDVRKLVVEDMKIQFIDGFGIGMYDVANFAIRRNIVVSASLDGIFDDGFYLTPDPVEGVIENNVIRDCGGGIGLLNGSSVAIRNNRIEDAWQTDGMFIDTCDGCMLVENSIRDVFNTGMLLNNLNNGKIYNNVVTAGQNGDGIALLANSSDNLVIENNASGNAKSGLAVDGLRNHIDRNVFNNNGNAGIWFMTNSLSNTFGRNTTRGNMAPPGPCIFTPPACLVPDICDDNAFGPGVNTSFGDNMGPGIC